MMKKTRAGCPKCSYVAKGKVNMKISEDVDEKTSVPVLSEKETQVDPITDFPCKKCKSKKAYFWIRQMRAGDEPESKFYKCVKCKNTTRVDN